MRITSYSTSSITIESNGQQITLDACPSVNTIKDLLSWLKTYNTNNNTMSLPNLTPEQFDVFLGKEITDELINTVNF